MEGEYTQIFYDATDPAEQRRLDKLARKDRERDRHGRVAEVIVAFIEAVTELLFW